MAPTPAFEEIAEAIAHCVHARMYLPEPYADRWRLTVDNMSSTAYEIPTSVLVRLGILSSLDKQGRRHEFACLPDEFGDRIRENKGNSYRYEILVLALICLLGEYPNQPDIHGLLVRLGVCEPLGHAASKNRWDDDVRVEWTDRQQEFEKLLDEWRESPE